MNTTHVPQAIAQWAKEIDVASDATSVPSLLIAAIMHVESGGGPLLHPATAAGTGDFAKRDPSKWSVAMPPDGLGWGRGLMQIDWFSHREFCSGPDWKDPAKNILMGASILEEAYKFFGGRLDATALAYNAGIAGAHHADVQAQGLSQEARRTTLDRRSAPPHRYVTAVLTRYHSFQ